VIVNDNNGNLNKKKICDKLVLIITDLLVNYLIYVSEKSKQDRAFLTNTAKKNWKNTLNLIKNHIVRPK
jgi:hypothetical protein